MLSTLYCIAKLSSTRSLEQLEEWKKNEVWVEITGHVKNPGKIRLTAGDTLKKAILACRPKADADLDSIDADLVLHKDFKLEILPLSKISIRVSGCVKKSTDLDLPVGSRVCDLKGIIDPAPGFDPAFFRRKRLLKNREEITVPEISK